MVALEARGHALYAKATKVLEENRHSHDHLLETLNHQVTELVALLRDLHHFAVEDQVHKEENMHKIHVIEEVIESSPCFLIPIFKMHYYYSNF